MTPQPICKDFKLLYAFKLVKFLFNHLYKKNVPDLRKELEILLTSL